MGDPACWMASTCPDCGRFLTPEEVTGSHCPHCDAALPGPTVGEGER